MTLILALLRKELFLKPRDRWFHVRRLLYIAVGGVIVLGVYLQQLYVEGNKAGLVMFEWLSLLVILSACLVAPFMATSAIVGEKENRTLSLLLMSDISIWQLLLSKLLSSVFTTFMTVISVLPLFILCESLGGIQFADQIMLAFPVLLATIVSGACLGLFVSAFVEREMRMQGIVALAAVSFYGLLPATVYAGCSFLFSTAQADRLLTVVSPIAAMMSIRNAANLDLLGWNCVYGILSGLPLLPLTVYALPRIHVRPGGVNGYFARLRERIFGLRSHQLREQRPKIIGNPVTWKDLHVHYGGEQNSWTLCLVSAVVSGALFGLVYLILCGIPATGQRFEVMLLVRGAALTVMVVTGVYYFYGAITRASQCCARERHDNTLEVLLTTDISAYSIVMGKSNAISLTLLPWIVTFVVSSLGFLFFSILDGNSSGLFILITAAATLNLLCMVYAYEYIAMYFSVKLQNFNTATALAGFVAWYVVGNLLLGLGAALFYLFTFGASVIAFPVAGPVLIGNHFRLRLIEEFHQVATRGGRQ